MNQPARVTVVPLGNNKFNLDVRVLEDDGKVYFGWAGPLAKDQVSDKIIDLLNHIHADKANIRDDKKA